MPLYICRKKDCKSVKCYQTRLEDKRPRYNSYEDLIEMLFKHYFGSYIITDEFGARDIRLIKPSELKEYIQEVSYRLSPTKKRFYKFKGILNLVFNYACDPERRYLEFNPVPCKNKAYEKNLELFQNGFSVKKMVHG